LKEGVDAFVLRALECELHKPETRRDRQRLATLLDSRFFEIGRSGATYTRDDILKHVPEEVLPANILARDFVALELAPFVVLLTYGSAQVSPSGALERPTNRASVWRLQPFGWQLVFHQGTAPADFAENATSPES
jgi:hypothetical protein